MPNVLSTLFEKDFTRWLHSVIDGRIMATKLATEHLVEYAGTFCSSIFWESQLPGLFQRDMLAGVYKCKDDHLMELK